MLSRVGNLPGLPGFAVLSGICALNSAKSVYSSRRITLNSYSQLPDVTILRGEYDWIREIPSQVLQQKVRDLDVAYRNFFEGRAEFPGTKEERQIRRFVPFPAGI